MADVTLHPAETSAARPWYRRRWWFWPLLLICLLAVYYVGGMLWLHTIDDDPDFGLPSSAPEGGSHAVAVAADLIDREINVHRWVANDPFFLPGSLLDNMPEFQQGIVAAIKQTRFALDLARHGKVPPPFPPHVAKDVKEARRLHDLVRDQGRNGFAGIVQGEHALGMLAHGHGVGAETLEEIYDRPGAFHRPYIAGEEESEA